MYFHAILPLIFYFHAVLPLIFYFHAVLPLIFYFHAILPLKVPNKEESISKNQKNPVNRHL